MTDRDRLIELLLKCDKENDVLSCFYERPRKKQSAEIIADYLIANGVILSPVDIGKTVYKVSRLGEIISLNVANYDYGVITFPYNIIPFENFGKTVFLTPEEAEKALERSKGNA